MLSAQRSLTGLLEEVHLQSIEAHLVFWRLSWPLGRVGAHSLARRCCALPQVCKVYIGSFNADVPVRTDLNPAGAELFEKEQADLLQDLYDIPQRACDRKARRLQALCINVPYTVRALTTLQRTACVIVHRSTQAVRSCCQ